MRKIITWVVAIAFAATALIFFYFQQSNSKSKANTGEGNRIEQSTVVDPEKLLDGIDESKLFAVTRRTEGGAVTVDAAFLNILKPEEKDLIFYVTLNTHTVDLSSYDIAKIAVLSNESKTVNEGFTWQAISDDGHHRSGILTIKNDGLFNNNTGFLELNLRTIGAVPDRKFKWDKSDWKK
ncbi:MAG TPA: hypothetical protein GXX35_02330 [Thermoanaerobacterales bacterium]|nr:hypothetical protein [Thermoanaerobacterales bacterium]